MIACDRVIMVGTLNILNGKNWIGSMGISRKDEVHQDTTA